jgi:hypothetical protein
LFRKIINEIKDVLFPKNCVGCAEEGSWLCGKCYQKLFFKSPEACLFCSKFITFSSICKDCVKKSALDGLVVLYEYQEKNVIARLIKLFKYSGVEDIVEVWERVFADFLSIDTEGMDELIVKSINFKIYRPKVICTEIIEQVDDDKFMENKNIVEILKNNDYLFYANTHINGIFIDKNLGII